MPNIRSPEAIARRQARRIERRRAARMAQDPTFTLRPRLAPEVDRVAHALERHRSNRRHRRDNRPFLGCDGEGTSNRGVFSYSLFRIGDRELFKNGRQLTTPELLTFILESPPPSEALLVGFAFEYDNSNILRDVPMEREKPDVKSRMERILNPDPIGKDVRFRDPWVWLTFDGFPEFGVAYLPRHHLKVCYAERYRDKDKVWRRRAVNGSIRTIEDAFGFFQTSFLTAINTWGVGEKYWARIKRNKERRSSFRTITNEVRRYNKLECELLSQMMDELREATLGAGIELSRWDGAGNIANYMLKHNGAERREWLERRLQKGLLRMAHAAYYGGRSEVTRLGHVGEPVIECDIGSAYPTGLLNAAPCHRHGKWRLVDAATLQKSLSKPDSLFVAPVRFHHPASSFLCGLPFRQESGTIMWPRDGRGVYWSIELRSARRLGCQVTIEGPGWVYERRCDCRPYTWLAGYYEARKALGKSTRGIPLKLGINSCYGKRSQRVGSAPWQSPIDAGLATAWTRARINDAIAIAGPRHVVMIATDAVYLLGAGTRRGSTARAIKSFPGGVGAGLGQWEVKEHADLFICQPGLYWPPKSATWRIKSRGVSAKFFEPHVPDFHKAWSAYLRRVHRWDHLSDLHGLHVEVPPSVVVQVTIFVGVRLAMHRKTYGDACKWLANPRLYSFDWSGKRGQGHVAGRSLVLDPKPGDITKMSVMYTPEAKPRWVIDAYESDEQIDDDLSFEAMPDDVDIGPPFK